MPDDTIDDYEKYKRDHIGPLERAGDFFAGIDERIDWLAPRIISALSEIRELEGKADALAEAIANIEIPGGVTVPKKLEQIPFVYNLAALQGVMLTEYAPFSGYIKQVLPHWPDGCNALVDVRVGHGITQFCPREGYLALNNVTPTYPFNELVEDHEEIWVEMRNTDGINAHNLTVTVMVESK